jgi:hypothetical protein
MKHIHHLYTLIIVCIICLQATSLRAQEWKIGVKAGMNVSDLGSPEVGYLSRLTYHGGLFTEAVVTPFFSLQQELLYSLQGAALDPSREIKLSYHYLNLPLIAKIYFYQDASLDLGLQYGFLISAIQNTDQFNNNITDNVRRTDFAGVIGVSYHLADQWIFQFRYNVGFTDTADRNIIYELRDTNRVLQISAGWLF